MAEELDQEVVDKAMMGLDEQVASKALQEREPRTANTNEGKERAATGYDCYSPLEYLLY